MQQIPRIDPQSVSPIMGRLWSPVAAVTCEWQGESNAQIAVSVCAASVVPSQPRALVQIYKENHSWSLIKESRAFALNFLRPDQLDLLRRFGFVPGRDTDKLAGVPFRSGKSGSPILEDCWGYLDCRVVNLMDGGDMTCFLGEVVQGETLSDSQPMWWPEARREMPPEWNAEWDRKIAAQIQVSEKTMHQVDFTPWRP